MYKKNIISFLLLTLSFSAFGAGIYKCKDENGQLTFSNKRCNVEKPYEGKIGESRLDYNSGTNYRAGGLSDSEVQLKRVESQNRASASSKSSNWREQKAKKLLNNLPHGKIGDRYKRDQMIREAEILLKK